MKTKIILCVVSLMIGLTAACGSGEKSDNANAVVDKKAANETAEKKDDKKAEFTGDVKFPFDFPTAGTTAKKGERVLVPSYNWLVDAMEKGADKTTMIWYAQTMEEPGEEMSQIKFMSDVQKVPNAYIVPIPAGQTAKKGDILLTWWQTGSGLQRAIVTDAADPKAPTVRYLDLDYTNPAKSRDGKTTIGQMDEQIKPDTFAVIKSEMEPGTAVAIGSDMKHGQVIRVEGDKVFVILFAGKTGVFPKADVKAAPLKPNVKAGDKVKAVSIGRFKDGTVSKVDENIGRVWVKFENMPEDSAVAFGDVMP
ncbi:hypothetical protein BH20ACI4_BH20ACI4_16960 [soil metagenome]